MLHDLSRLVAFESLSSAGLRVLAAHARYLDVPAGRWLVRRGRTLSGHHYLVRGSLLTRSPDGLLAAGDPAARRPVYPGALELKTVTDCRLLQLSEDGLAAVAELESPDGLILVSESASCWQTRFLESHLMTGLAPIAWQRVLSRLVRIPVNEGDVVIEEGTQTAGYCCVLATGAAEVSRGGVPIAVLGPGDLFGEDALIAGHPRNATVRMREAGVVMRLDANAFSGFLEEVLDASGLDADTDEASAFANGSGANPSGRVRTLLRVRSTVSLRDRIEHLSPSVTYLVSAASPSVAVLAIFLLRKRGIAARLAPGG